MKGEKRLRAALPYLGAEELRMIWKDCRRAQDVAAIGGATERRWNEYVSLADDVWREFERRFPDKAKSPIDYTKSWTPEEYDRLAAIHRRIQKGMVGGSAK